MNKLLNDTKIATKILVPLLIVAFVGILGAAYSGWQMKSIGAAYSEQISQRGEGLLWLARTNVSMQQLGLETYRVTFYDANDDRAKTADQAVTKAFDDINDRLDKAAAAAPFWQEDIEKFRGEAANVMIDSRKAIEFGMRNDQVGGLPYNIAMDDKLVAFSERLRAFNEAVIVENQKQLTALAHRTDQAVLITVGSLLLVTILGVLASLMITAKGITGPLTQLRELMTKLANADFSVDVIGQDRKDEVGQMAKTVQVFKENGIRAHDLDIEANRLREQNEQERAVVAREQEKVAHEQEKVVSQLADGLSRLSDGDLAFTLNEQFAAEYEKLRSDFNGAMVKLKQTMQTVSGNTHGIRGGADEISQAADDLSRRTEQQAASLEETAAALDEITATVRTTAENANEARRVVAEASESAKHSGEVVGQAVEAMSKIEKSSQQISQIIGVIDEIAFQTNLLALNAGVEAARAGDAGRGFAVVASEVRALAQRSAEAAKEIKTLISASSLQVDQGVSLVAETGAALKGIVEQVAKINHLVADIAASAQEQATGLQQVNTAVNQMDQVTQQNAAMVEESTAASHSLAQETEQLSRLIGQFRTGENVNEVVAIRKRPSHQASPQRQVQATHSAMKTTGYGGAAQKSHHEPVEESWEEF